MQKFKIGDFVQMSRKAVRCQCEHMKEWYSNPDGSIPEKYTADMAALLGARYLGFALTGYVLGYGSETNGFDGETDHKYTRVCLMNRFGVITTYLSGQDLLRKNRIISRE